GAYRNAQVNWFAKILKETPSDYQVALFEHNSLGDGMYATPKYYCRNYDLIEGIIQAFIGGGSFKKSNTAEVDFKASVDITFDHKGVICFIANGHHHKDRLKQVAGIMDMNTICSKANPGYDDPNRPLGDVKEDAWDVILIHPDTR